MVLNIETFTNPGAKGWRPGNNVGGSTLFKALGHPLAAGKAKAVRAQTAGGDVQKVEEAGSRRPGHDAELITALPHAQARTVLIAAFDAKRLADQIRHLIPEGAELLTFDALRLPDDMLSNPRNYLDPP